MALKGITLNGKPLKSWFDKNEIEDPDITFKEAQTLHAFKGKHIKEKYRDRKEKNGPVKHLTKKEIKEYGKMKKTHNTLLAIAIKKMCLGQEYSLQDINILLENKINSKSLRAGLTVAFKHLNHVGYLKRNGTPFKYTIMKRFITENPSVNDIEKIIRDGINKESRDRKLKAQPQIEKKLLVSSEKLKLKNSVDEDKLTVKKEISSNGMNIIIPEKLKLDIKIDIRFEFLKD